MSNQITATTQEHLDILDIKDDFVILKTGVVSTVLYTTAVNFDLLSEVEQDALISAFSMLLNSVTFPVQVVVRSKKLDISKYVEKVQRIESKITDPLMKIQAQSYRKFVQDVIKQNDVLDKKFYVVISTGAKNVAVEPGSGPFDWIARLMGTQNKRVNVNVDQVLSQARAHLTPRADHLVKEFNRLGVKARKLNTQELVELYFDLYNPSSLAGQRIRTNVEDYKSAIVSPAILEE
jgi:hypothetical protein